MPHRIYVPDDGVLFVDKNGVERGRVDLEGVGGAAVEVGPHTHAQSEITDLTTDLAAKVGTSDPRLSDARTPTSHTHTKAQITDFAHTHPQSEVTNLTTDLAGKAPTSHTHTASQITDFNAAGDARWAPIGGGGGGFAWHYVGRQPADVTQLTAAFGNSGLSFSYAINSVYAIELYLLMRSSLATAGFRLALDVSSAVTTVALTFNHQLANSGTVTAGQSRADATATGMSSGVDTINADIPIIGNGLLVTGANTGTATLVYGPEVLATATLRANSVMRVHKVA